MKRRTIVRLVSFSLALATVFLGLWLVQRQRTSSCQNLLSLSYEQAAQQLSSSLWDMNTDLEKLQYANDPQACGKLALALMGRAQTAKTALSNFPNAEQLEVINRFLSQVGNYAVWLTEKRRTGLWDEEEYRAIASLQQTAGAIGSIVDETVLDEQRMDQWGLQVEEQLSRRVPEDSLANRLLTTEESLTDYPTLLYDGPYSDHIDTTDRPLLDQSKPVTFEEAKQVATELFGFGTQLQSRADTTGKIPAYVISDENAELTVCKNGGYPLHYRRYRAMEQEKLSATNAGQIADEFLKRCGFDNMVQTYYELGDGLYTFCYAYLEGETICYADLIKVGVAADNGDVMLLSTDGYLSNHRPRTLETPAVTAEQAAGTLSPSLTPESVKQVLIPKTAGGEVLCHELLCTAPTGRKVLLYLNTVDGKQEELFLVEENPNGIFVK